MDFRSIWSNQDIQRVTQYQNKNSRIVEVQNGLNSFLIVDDDITDKTISNTVLGNQIKNNIKESSTIRIKKGEDLGFTFGEKDYFLPAENNTQDASEKVIVISLPKQNE